MNCAHNGCNEQVPDLCDYCEEHQYQHCQRCGELADWDGDTRDILCIDCQVSQAEMGVWEEDIDWDDTDLNMEE